MPRSCESAHEDSKVEAQRGRDSSHSYWSLTHGPRGTTHGTSGGVHGYGWSRGGGSSFRQGAGVASPGSPDLETAAAAVQRGVHGKEINIRGFHPGAKYRRRGVSRGPTRQSGGSLARPRVGPRHLPSWLA